MVSEELVGKGVEESSLACFDVLLQYFLGQTEEKHKVIIVHYQFCFRANIMYSFLYRCVKPQGKRLRHCFIWQLSLSHPVPSSLLVWMVG